MVIFFFFFWGGGGGGRGLGRILGFGVPEERSPRVQG